MSENDVTDANADQPPKGRWLKPVLVVSLALNLLFVGVVAGAFLKFRDGPRGGPKHRIFELSLVQMISELPPDRRQTGESVLARLRSDVIPAVRGGRGVRKEAVAAMIADPYDEQRMKDVLVRLRETRAGTRRGMHDLFLEFIRELSVEERKRFLEVVRAQRRALRRRGPGRRDNNR